MHDWKFTLGIRGKHSNRGPLQHNNNNIRLANDTNRTLIKRRRYDAALSDYIKDLQKVREWAVHISSSILALNTLVPNQSSRAFGNENTLASVVQADPLSQRRATTLKNGWCLYTHNIDRPWFAGTKLLSIMTMLFGTYHFVSPPIQYPCSKMCNPYQEHDVDPWLGTYPNQGILPRRCILS